MAELVLHPWLSGDSAKEERMIRDTIQKIEIKLQNANSIKDENKAELLKLVSTLKSEIAELSKTNIEHAESITGFAGIATHEATREDRDLELLKLSLEGLSSSVKGFETSHPQLVDIVNSICLMLVNSGV
jgi:prophage DNA circulation protein